MKILAIDTSAIVASAALYENDEPIAFCSQKSGLTHSETMLPIVRDLLRNAKTELSNIDLFAVSAGPGSFTGIRIGISTIKGLAFGMNKPCIGVSTLEAMAWNIAPFCEGEIICPVMDARRNQVYAALFTYRNGKPFRLTEDSLWSADALVEQLASYHKPVRFMGDGYYLLEKKAPDFMLYTPKASRFQSGCGVALAAYDLYEASEDKSRFTDILLRPEYLRPSQAERELAEKQKMNTEEGKSHE